MRRLLLLLVVVSITASLGAATMLAAPATSREAPSLAAAIRSAKTHVSQRFGISGLHSVQGLRSKRNRTWAAVNGYYRKPRRQPNLWVVYLRVRDGRWRVTYSGIGRRAIEPRVPGVPCDVWPPFSEPSC
jgi:type II secretory pathway pseudopilin PulG